MYRIYMPVDLVIAITHSKMRKHNKEKEKKVENVKGERCETREKFDNSDNVKQHKCLDILRLW